MKILLLRAPQRVTLEEREDPPYEVPGYGHLEVEDSITAASDCPNAKHGSEETRLPRTELRDVERQRDPIWHRSTAQPADGHIEAAFPVDEPRHPVAQVSGESIQPFYGTWPFLLIDRTGRIVTAHVEHPTKRV